MSEKPPPTTTVRTSACRTPAQVTETARAVAASALTPTP